MATVDTIIFDTNIYKTVTVWGQNGYVELFINGRRFKLTAAAAESLATALEAHARNARRIQ